MIIKLLTVMLTKNIFYKMLFILLTSNCFAQLIPEGWNQQQSNVGTSLNSVYFLNSLTGWSAGNNGVILKTTNGGAVWEQQSSLINNDLKKIYISSLQIGYIIGTSGLILKTTNSGFNWFQQNSGTNNNLTSSSFTGDNTGYVSGVNNTLLKTTNGGLNWNSISFEDSVNYFSIYFVNNSKGWLSSVKSYSDWPDSAFIMKTTNGGVNWFSQNTQWIDASPIQSMQFTDSLNGWCTRQVPTISSSEVLKTTDGGNVWISYSPGLNGDNYSLYFVNNLKGWCSGPDNSIYRTNNGGINWVRSNSFHILSFFYRSIFFTDSLTGWTVGFEGTILKTTTGGVLTNFTGSNLEVPPEYNLEQNYPNPFNPVTNLEFTIPNSVFVSIKIYDVLGNEIITFVNERKPPGNFDVIFDGSNFPSGIYFYDLVVDGKIIDTKRMLLLK